jgi:KaiC/GvpD/RAD55 family RecA-like ATPase
MRRRVLLRGAIALPVVAAVGVASTHFNRARAAANTGHLFSGLTGLDYALGGVAAGELICVTSPPHSGKTVVLLDWAARICSRYGKNVVFYSANEPSVYIARKAVAKGRTPVFFAGETQNQIPYDRDIGSSGAIVMLDSQSADLERAQSVASWLAAKHSAGCAALVSDGWCTNKQRPLGVKVIEGVVRFPAERWVPTLLSLKEMSKVAEFAQVSRLPVVMGVQTASLMDDEALAESFHLSSQLRLAADRWVSMCRPELYVDTEDAIAADKNVVCLSGTSPQWWDTRFARLRFYYGMRQFETVV